MGKRGRPDAGSEIEQTAFVFCADLRKEGPTTRPAPPDPRQSSSRSASALRQRTLRGCSGSGFCYGVNLLPACRCEEESAALARPKLTWSLAWVSGSVQSLLCWQLSPQAAPTQARCQPGPWLQRRNNLSNKRDLGLPGSSGTCSPRGQEGLRRSGAAVGAPPAPEGSVVRDEDDSGRVAPRDNP